MKTHNKFATALLAGLVSSILTGCGGSSTDSTAQTIVTAPPTVSQPPPAASLPTLIRGEVQDYGDGKLTVNSRVLDISGASLSYGNTSISASALTTNMQVTVTTSGSEVLSVMLNPNIAGVVTAVDASSVSVNGFTISTNEHAGNVNTNDYVVITSSTAANGQLSASALVVLSGSEIPTFIELEGAISGVNTANQTFTLNEFTVDYAGAPLAGINLQNGLWVEVFGSISGNKLIANEVELDNMESSAETEISGVITWIDDEKLNFDVNQRFSYTVSTSTRFNDGTQQDLAIGRQVQVTSEQINGIMQVSEIEFEDDISVPPSPPNALNLSFDVTGTMTFNANVLSFNGFEFEINTQTRFEDGLTLDTLDTLDGVSIELDGVVSNGTFIIREIERADAFSEIDLEGNVTNGSLWGYQTEDNSLDALNNQWVSVECRINGVLLSACMVDVD